MENTLQHVVDLEDILDQRGDDAGENFEFPMRQNLVEVVQRFAKFAFGFVQPLVMRIGSKLKRVDAVFYSVGRSKLTEIESELMIEFRSLFVRCGSFDESDLV